MDVKSGSGKKQHQARRKTDVRDKSRVVRNLQWGHQPTDIDLHPQSPLTIGKALSTSGSRIALLPAPDSPIVHDPDSLLADYTHDQDKVTPIRGRQSKQRAPISAGILTTHSPDSLRERCRELAVESALVKNKNDKHLYLAVGFLNWQSDPLKDTRNYSALLFYPMRLISEENHTGNGIFHVLHCDEGLPEYNHHLAEMFLEQTGTQLPEFNPRQSLEYFLEQTEACLRSDGNTVLEYRMQLGITAAPAGISPAAADAPPPLVEPTHLFRSSLAKDLMNNHDLEQLQVTLSLLNASNDYTLKRSSDQSEIRLPDIAKVREFSVLLAQYGLGNVEFQYLPDLPDRVNDWIKDIEPALNSELIVSTLDHPDIGAVHLMKLTGIIELIDKAPDSIERQLHRDLAYSGTPLLFKRARHQAILIEEELAELQQHFHLDRLPAKSQLLHLIQELGGAHNSDIEVVDSHYFNARRQFMNFSTDKPTSLSNDHKRLLNKLVKVLRFRELFINNTEYRLAMGPGYRGLKTDWNKLEKVLDYAQELRRVIGSSAIASSAIANWQDFRPAYTRSLNKLQAASVGIQGLLQVVRPSDHTTTTAELLVKAQWLSDQLRGWNLDYGLISNYGDKTANGLLRLFTGKARIDAQTESLVRDANTKIQNFLLSNTNQGAWQQVTETLDWLSSAVHHEAVNLEEIVRIVESADTKLEQ